MAPPSPGPERLPLLLLLLALSTLFPYSFDKGYFYHHGTDNWNTAKNLAIAENLSPDRGFRLFLERRQEPGDALEYEMYGRFPVGGFALIKLAIIPFGDDLSASILAARILMLLLFGAAALLAFLSLARVTSHPWIALAATLAAFSSYYMLFYRDEVSNEMSMDLFAVMLVFHGMVVFVQEGRFRQLLARTCVALLLGWHVYAFLLPFLILGTASEAMGAWKDGTAVWPRVRSTGAAVLRSRYMALGLFSLLFGSAVLGFNFANEYAAFGGQTPVTELPSFQSMLKRTGLDQDPSFDPGWWLRFLRQQFFRVCVASVPFVLTDWGVDLLEWFSSTPFSASVSSGQPLWVSLPVLLMVMVASMTVVRLAGPLLARRRRMLVATLALSGFFWALPMRHSTASPGHDFEALHYVGVPLVFYSLLLLYLHKRWGHGPVVGLAVAALLAFVVSTFQMNHRWRPDAPAAEPELAALAEFGSIRETTRGKGVLLLASVKPDWAQEITASFRYTRIYNLAGSVLIQYSDVETAARAADFLLTRDRVESNALLTPRNEQVFLYDSAGMDDLVEFYRATYRQVVSGEPAARSHFDVYLGDRALFHVREPCAREDLPPRVFVAVTPEDPKDLHRERLPRWRRRSGLNRYSSPFRRHGVLFEGKCMAILPLPDYPVSNIRTGQDEGRRGRVLWEARIPAR